MTKARFALLTAALGLATMVGAGYVAFAGSSSGSGSHGAGAQGGGTAGAQGGGQGVQLTPTGGESTSGQQESGSPTTGLPLGKPTSGDSGVPRCGDSDVQVSQKDGGGAAGHLSLLLVFTDVSGHDCSLQGYPGASLLGPDGKDLLDADRTPTGYSGGAIGLKSPPTLVLHANGTASAVVEWSDVPTGSGPNGGCAVPNPASLAVTPPNTKATSTIALAAKSEVCSGFEVHPVLPGIGNTPGGD